MTVGPGIPRCCCISCDGGGGNGRSLSVALMLTGTALAVSRTGGGGGTVSVVAVEAAEAPPSVVELLVVSDKSRYFKSSLPGSSEGLDDDVEEEEGQASRIMEPFVKTPKRTGLEYLTEALGRHSTSGASVEATGASPGSPPYTSGDPNFDKELTHSCTWVNNYCY